MMFNAADEPVNFTLPDGPFGKRWRAVFDTNKSDVPRLDPISPITAVLPDAALANAENQSSMSPVSGDDVYRAGSDYLLTARSVVVFERVS
jgi:hypothetical protein